MSNVIRKGSATFHGKTHSLRVFVENDDCMIIIADIVIFLNIRYGIYFSGPLIREPMSKCVQRMLDILEKDGIHNILEEPYATEHIGPYSVPIPQDISSILWKGEFTTNGRAVRSNYRCFKLDVFQSLANKSA